MDDCKLQCKQQTAYAWKECSSKLTAAGCWDEHQNTDLSSDDKTGRQMIGLNFEEDRVASAEEYVDDDDVDKVEGL